MLLSSQATLWEQHFFTQEAESQGFKRDTHDLAQALEAESIWGVFVCVIAHRIGEAGQPGNPGIQLSPFPQRCKLPPPNSTHILSLARQALSQLVSWLD